MTSEHSGIWRRVFAARIATQCASMIAITLMAGGAAAQSSSTPIKLGDQRQLLIDDFLIDSVTNLTRRLHRPQPHPKNPIMTGTANWERWLIGVNGRAVIYDEETQEFKMWYGAYFHDPNLPYDQGYRVCYAVSKDGINWTRPEIGQVEWQGSRKNNILRSGDNWMRRPNVIKDVHESDPNRRYKMTYVDMIDGKSAIVNAYSRDGIRWTNDGKPWFRPQHSSNLLGWDPLIREYVLYPRMEGSTLAIGRSTSPDFTIWSEPESILAPEPSEAGKRFAGNAAFMYQNIYLGFLWIFQRSQNGFKTVPQIADTELVFSREGRKWQRIFPNYFFLPRGKPGTWDREGVTPVAPVLYKDQIWIYYSGWNYPYGSAALKPVQEGWIKDGLRMQCAIGLATLRLDGFVSFDADQQPGVLTTKQLEVSGSLIVNADVRGKLLVAVLDEAGHSVPGFSAKNCEPIRSDSVRHVVRWKGKRTLDSLKGKPVRLKFTLQEGSLYSFTLKS
jgi:hypothetical protein